MRLPKEILRFVALCEQAAVGNGQARKWAQELSEALTVLSTFDEQPDLVLHYKELMVLEGHEEFRHQIYGSDRLSDEPAPVLAQPMAAFSRLVESMGREGRVSFFGMMNEVRKIRVVDSHTAGEPTRVVIAGGPVIPEKGAAAARSFLKEQEDWMRCALIHEPRGFEAVVGAFLCEPLDESCGFGVVFFNNSGYLNGCLHGTMGVIETLAFLGKISAGSHRLETPVGVITAELHHDGRVTVTNVPSYRYRSGVVVEVPRYGSVTGEVAWGGNWFYLIEGQGPEVKQENIGELTAFTWAVRQALDRSEHRGEDGSLIDHVEVFGAPQPGVAADSQNFVMCPGRAYDRSPCGTGTSAKMACLAANGHFEEGEIFRQAGILGTTFEGSYRRLDEDRIAPMVTGQAYVTAESEIVLRADDPYCYGVEWAGRKKQDL